MHKIMIVEDDRVIAGAIKRHIEKWDCEAVIASDFRDVMGEFQEYQPELVLLDISLPLFNGYHWCTQIRSVSNVPIIFISSTADNMNIVMAMNMGGDDFVAKPFDLNVLTAKIQALLRRAYGYVVKPEEAQLSCRGAVLMMGDASLEYEGEKIDLTKNEFKILQMLMANTGKVVSRDEIMMKLWDTDSFIDENTLTVNVARLRKKLEQKGLDDFIKTKKGMGYLVE